MTLPKLILTMPAEFKDIWQDKAVAAWNLEQEWLLRHSDCRPRNENPPARGAATRLCWLRSQFPSLQNAPLGGHTEIISFCLFLYSSSILYKSTAFAVMREQDLTELKNCSLNTVADFLRLLDKNKSEDLLFEHNQKLFFRNPIGNENSKILAYTALKIMEQILEAPDWPPLDNLTRFGKKIFEYRERYGIEGECTLEALFDQGRVKGVIQFLQWMSDGLNEFNGLGNRLIVETLLITLRSTTVRVFSIDDDKTIRDLGTGKDAKCEPLLLKLLALAIERHDYSSEEIIKILGLSAQSLYKAGSHLNKFMKDNFGVQKKIYKASKFGDAVMVVRPLQ